MNDILYTANQKFYLAAENGIEEFTSEKIEKYIATSKDISRRHEWKTSGAGAQFMNSYVPKADDDSLRMETSINGISDCGGDVLYSATLGEVSGLFRKPLDTSVAEGLIMSSRDMRIYKVSAFEGQCAASVGGRLERHIAIFNIETGTHRELTEGEVQEDYPSYSRDGRKIFYNSAGLGISHSGLTGAVGPHGIFCYDIQRNEMQELLASDNFDYIAPKEDGGGNLILIKRPYKGYGNGGNFLLDLLLFPVRIIKAIAGLLNYFSIAFGGESLRSGGADRDIKSKQINEKDLFFDGNVINAQQSLKANQRRGEKFPGIIPHSWELTKIDKEGNQFCLKKGVMDYCICENGDIVYSNGNAIIRLAQDGTEQLIERCRMACNIAEITKTPKNSL